jgi:ParB-like chromosome segregation protein Spo0J
MPTPIDAIRQRPRNPRKIAKAALDRLAESIKRDPEFMRLRPIVVDTAGEILGGNQRWRACKQLGMKELPDGWVVRAADLTPDQRRRFVLVDNAPEGMAGEWDKDILAADWKLDELVDLGLDKDMTGFDGEATAETAPAPSHPECRISFPPRVWLTQRHEIIAALQDVVGAFGGAAKWPV